MSNSFFSASKDLKSFKKIQRSSTFCYSRWIFNLFRKVIRILKSCYVIGDSVSKNRRIDQGFGSCNDSILEKIRLEKLKELTFNLHLRMRFKLKFKWTANSWIQYFKRLKYYVKPAELNQAQDFWWALLSNKPVGTEWWAKS